MIGILFAIAFVVIICWATVKLTKAVGREIGGNASTARYIRDTHRTQPAQSPFTAEEIAYFKAHTARNES